MEAPELELADGWREVPPREGAPDLLLEEAGRLRHYSSGFALRHEFGRVGQVPCPIAYSPETRTAYRHVCESRPLAKDFSELRAYDLRTGRSHAVARLRVNQWMLWLLEWIGPADRSGESGCLFGLLATDAQSAEQVSIQHHLFFCRPEDGRVRRRPLCRDAYAPLALGRSRRALVFAGAEGLYLVGLNGERRASLVRTEGPLGRGASFEPGAGGRVALGGNGLYLWNPEEGRCQKLAQRGHYPAWSADGRGIFYSESSADLWYHELASGRATRLAALRRNRQPEFTYARQPAQSPCGRYVMLPLTVKQMRGVSGAAPGGREYVYDFGHGFCVFDLERREVWRKNGYSGGFCWAPGAGAA